MALLHPDLRHVAPLLGTWSGTGAGEYPTIEPFEFAESVTFGHVGKPFLSYQQRTRSLGTPEAPGQPMHSEAGYWRFPGRGQVEVVLSHPTGVTEIEEGTVQIGLGGVIEIELVTTSVSLTASAKEVTALRRSIRVHGDELDYRLSMAAVGRPLLHHLEAHLVRETDDD